LDVTIEDIEKYLEEVKEAINDGRYRVEMNENRQDNQDLFFDYIVDEDKSHESCGGSSRSFLCVR
jgi:hypothetical protein